MKNVSAKLLKAIEQVGGTVPKTGWNNFSKYKYITESDINTVVLPALLKQGLLLTTSLESVVETPAGPESKNRFATVHLIHTITDVDSAEVLTLKSAGIAADVLDKAIYKAYTGACKYFMMKLFLISGDDSDPENDGEVVTNNTPTVNKGTTVVTPTKTAAFGSFKKPEAIEPEAPKKTTWPKTTNKSEKVEY